MLKPRLLALSVGFVLFLGAGAPAAWPARWRSIGPEGGYVSALSFAPSDSSVAYAGTQGGGVFRSGDGGSSWSAVNNGLGNLMIVSLAVDPSNSALVYAGTSGGLYKTTSGGASWRRLPLGSFPSITVVLSLRINPASPNVVYASFSDAALNSGVFRTDDGGSHWTKRDAGLPGGVSALDLDPDHPDTLYGVNGSSSGAAIPLLYKTTDGGGSWTLLPGLKATQIFAFARQRSTGTLYVSTLEGLFATRDEGATWTLLYLNLFEVLVAMPSGTLYGSRGLGGVVSSVDGGRTWNDPIPSAPGSPHGQTTVLALDLLGDHLLVGTAATGIFSLGAATGWTQVNRGLQATDITGLAVSSTSPPLLFAATFGGGVFASSNGGAGFSARNTGIPASFVTETFASGIATSPRAPRSLVTGTFLPQLGSVAQTSDAGRHWTSETPSCLLVDALALNPPSTLFVASTSAFLGDSCPDPSSCTAKVSHDGGSSFACLDGPQAASAFLIDPVQQAVVYAAAGDAIWKSTDNGEHFALAASNLGMIITSLVASPAAPQTLYAGGVGGVLKSTDGGASWSSASSALPGAITALVVDPSKHSLVYALVYGGGAFPTGVFESHNGGASWRPLGIGFPAGVFTTALALDPVHHILYAGTQGSGAWALALP
jgi:photosystem II stability/assembly factor-like uncharacterized protein